MNMSTTTPVKRAFAGMLLCIGPWAPSWAAETNEIAELRRAIEALRAENRALAERLATLESRRSEPAPETSGTNAAARGDARETQRLEQRVNELENAKTAQEDAVRSIIRDSVSTLGSKINEAASLGGTLGVSLARNKDFSGERKGSIGLSSADFEFEIRPNDWALGHVMLEYVDGKQSQLSSTGSAQTGVDRITLDTAYIAVGDQQRFPALLTAGRMVLPFGISTGHPVADVLSIASPLTVEAFEMRQNAVSLSLAFPTPPLKPPTPPVTAAPVRPLVVYPLIDSASRSFGYDPPPVRLTPLSPIAFAPERPPFHAGLYVFDGSTPGGLRKHLGGTFGYHAKGHCGRRYEEISGIGVCPWAVNVDFGYNSSIFNSRFLEAEYGAFLNQIGRVPGASASVKASLGPFALVGEWNGAIRRASFVDDAGDSFAIKPRAWQVSLAYQLGWNPWVQEIGAQGTYLAIGYSKSRDLAGATRLIDGADTRFGFVPKRRITLTAGEWVLDGLRLVFEYSHDQDYSDTEGGTGNSAHGISATLTYVW